MAFLTTQRFLELFWERGLKQNNELGMLLSSMDSASDGGPIDKAQWFDFIGAYDDVAQRLAQ